jgi:hypothetical protein
LLLGPSKETQVSIASGSQSERIVADFRNAGFQSVMALSEGYFEDWVEREVERS